MSYSDKIFYNPGNSQKNWYKERCFLTENEISHITMMCETFSPLKTP